MRTRGRTAAVVLATAVAVGAIAVAARPTGTPMTKANTVQSVAASLRCPTCQGLSAADSPSAVAVGIRDTIAQQLDQGRSPDQFRAWFVARYSSWILLSPPRSGLNWLVWTLPAAMIAGLVALLARLGNARRRRARSLPVAARDTAERTVGLFRAGELAVPDSPRGERLESALTAAVLAKEDGLPDGAALRGVAQALDGLRGTPDRRPGRAGQGRRVAVRAAAAAAVAAVILAVLTASIRSRQPEQVATGDPFPQPAANTATTGTGAAVASVFVVPPVALPQALSASRDRPLDPGAWIALGRARDTSNDLAGAERAYRTARRLAPSDRVPDLLLGGLLLRGGSPSEAERLMFSLRRSRPRDPDMLLVLGLAEQQLKDPTYRRTLAEFLAAAPNHPMAQLVASSLRNAR